MSWYVISMILLVLLALVGAHGNANYDSGIGDTEPPRALYDPDQWDGQ